ncbi:MAG: type II secretion system protein GspD, partial [Acidobacteria bacterium]|nr:type II secretion system protein GspD [Acidobacteriota bacterium]
RQVLINVKIYEMVLDDELSMGVSAFLQDRGNPVVPGPGTTTANYGGGGAVAAGLNLATQALMGNTRELVAFLNAAETRRRSRVLSAPSVIASDNVAARIQVGSQIPILTSQGVVPGGTGGSSLFSNTIQNRNTGVILDVTPRINAGGWVTLEVEQEVSSPGPPPVGGIQSPSINIRSVTTQVTVKNAQTIAIGGIISETKGRSRSGVPFLGRIPGLGLLFGSTSRKTSRTELIALITPHVIEDIEQASDLTDALKSTLKGLKKELRKAES